MGEGAIDIMGLATSEGPTSMFPYDATSKDTRCRIESLDVETGGEGRLERDNKGAIAADKDAVIEVDGYDVDKSGPNDGDDGMIHVEL